MIGEPCCSSKYISVKIDSSNEKIVKSLKEELLFVRNKINELYDFIDNTDNKLSDIEWTRIKNRRRNMDDYYYSIIENCKLYNIIDSEGNIIN